jgi:hypothetical protein
MTIGRPEGTPMKRTLALTAAAAAALVLAGLTQPAHAAQTGLPGASAMLTRAPYLTDLTQTSVQVNWADSVQGYGTAGYGPAGNCAAGSVTSAHRGNPITVAAVTEYQNSLTITGLTPGTAYCYRISSGGVDLLDTIPSPQFTTLQPAGSVVPFTFDVLGDWGDTATGNTNTGAVNRSQANVDSLIAGSGAQFAVTTGDMAYPGGTQNSYGDLDATGPDVSAVFGPSYWAAPGMSVPLFAVSGNHGKNATYLSTWPETATVAASSGVYAMTPYPSVAGSVAGTYPTSYYAFTTGSARFYALDAAWGNSALGTATGGTCGTSTSCKLYQVDAAQHWTTTSAEYVWLAKDLAAHPGGVKFAFFHFPLHSANATESSDTYLDGPGNLEQLLHDAGVSIVLNGHAHIYQRNTATSPDSVRSYVTGGGGAPLEPVSACGGPDAYAIGWSYTSSTGTACGSAPEPTSDAQVYSFLKVTVAGTSVTVTPTNSAGHTFDVHTYTFATP